MKVYTIQSPYFDAGIVVLGGYEVVKAAPIVTYMLGWSFRDVCKYVKKKKWKIY